MIRFYYHPTPNPAKVALFLEEVGLPYETVPIDTNKGEQLPGPKTPRHQAEPKTHPTSMGNRCSISFSNLKGRHIEVAARHALCDLVGRELGLFGGRCVGRMGVAGPRSWC